MHSPKNESKVHLGVPLTMYTLLKFMHCFAIKLPASQSNNLSNNTWNSMETARLDSNLLLMTSPGEILQRPRLSGLYYSRALMRVTTPGAHFRSNKWKPFNNA